MNRNRTSETADVLRRLERRLRWYRGVSVVGLASLLATTCAMLLPGGITVDTSPQRPLSLTDDDGRTCNCRPTQLPAKQPQPATQDQGRTSAKVNHGQGQGADLSPWQEFAAPDSDQRDGMFDSGAVGENSGDAGPGQRLP